MTLGEAEFAGQVAIVTGGASGIGRAIALRFAAAGAAVVIADRDAPRGDAAAADIRSRGARAIFVQMDLGRSEDCLRTVEATLEEFRTLDILINCAAVIGPLKPVLELTLADWNEVIGANVTGTFVLTQAAVRRMLAAGNGGAVVNILAIQAFVPLPNHCHYATSKGALTSFTRSLAVELSAKGIRVNGIAVGSVYTEGVQAVLRPQASGVGTVEVPGEVDASAATLVGRMGRPDDIANVALFLASKQASYVTGAIIPADGGRLLSRKADPFLERETESRT